MFLIGILCALAEDRWATEDVQGHRWPDSTVVTVKLSANEQVEVLVVDGPLARVRKGADFGWVEVSKLATTAPAKPPPVDGDVPLDLSPPSP